MSDAQTYTVALPTFEGPLELLLDLIEKRELEITELTISQVTGDYLAAISALEKVNINDLHWFLDIGTRLVSYKVRAIRRDNIDNGLDDSDDDITSQIARYQEWRELASGLQKKFTTPLTIRNQQNKQTSKRPSGYNNLNIQSLRSIWLQIYANEPLKIHRKQVSITRHDLEKTMQKLLERLGNTHNMNASLDRTSRYSLALSFLALLELIKQDLIEIVFEKDTAYVKAIR